MSEWIDPRHAHIVERFRAAQAATKSTACLPCGGLGVQGDASCRPCSGTGRQRAVRMFITS